MSISNLSGGEKSAVRFGSRFPLLVPMALLVALGYLIPALYRPYVWTALFLLAALAIVLLVAYRRRMKKSHAALLRIVSPLPNAVIVSDISGNIVFLNAAATAAFSNRGNQLGGLSYFSTFLGHEGQGAAISKYISYFDLTNTGSTPIKLHLRGEHELILDGSLTVMEIDGTRYAVTTVEKVRN